MKSKHLLFALLVLTMVALLFFASRTAVFDRNDYSDKEFRWYSNITDEGDFLVRGARVDSIRNDLNKLIAAVNQTRDDPESLRALRVDQEARPVLKLRSREGQVVHVEVINAEHLTQRMGSLGAQEFLATATFTLTEFDGVDAVRFVFEPGDHAMPGVYTRESFLENWRTAGSGEGSPSGAP
jgi:hypothetical protein